MRPAPKSIPSLRFPVFNDTWKRWLLDHFATRGSGHTPSKSHPHYYGGEIDWVSLADSNRLDNGYIEKTKTKITDSGLRHSSAVLHPPGTVILSRDAGIGKSAVMKHSMAVSQHFIVWRPTEGTSIDWFIYYWLQIMKPEFERIAIGSTIKTIGLPYFKKLEISAPTLPEQRKIAEFLTAVDGRIAQLRQKKALLEDYKKGVMQQLFTQALRFKDDHGNEFPEWEEKRLGDVTKWSSGGTPAKDKPEYWDGDIPWMTAASMHGRYYDDSPLKITPVGLCNGSRMTQKGSILLLVRGSMLWNRIPVGIVIRDVAFNQDVKALAPSGEVLASFLLQWFIGSENKLLHTVVGTGIGAGKLDTDEMKSMELLLPSLPEQTKIANFLTALDRKIESVSSQITHTQAFKKGLLQQMFV
jgi:type I restriction enzyme S subunit